MKKFYPVFGILFLLFSLHTHAQQNIQKVPKDVKMLAQIDFKKLTTLMPVKEWDKSEAGKALLKYSYESSGKKLKSITDLGIDLNGSMYFYLTENDSMQFYNILMPLADANKTKNLYAKQDIQSVGNGSWMVFDKDSSAVQMWNNEHLLYVRASAKQAYFDKPEVAKNHGLTVYNPYDYSIYSDSTMAILDTSAILFDEEVTVDTVIEEEKIEIIEAPEIDDSDSDDYDTDSDDNGVDHVYFTNIEIKKRLAIACAKAYVQHFFSTPSTESISNNPQYIKSKNSNAVASFFVDNPENLYQSLIPAAKSFYNLGLANENESGMYESFSAHLLMDEKQININGTIAMSEEISALQQKIMDRKLNPAFLNYVQMDHMLGYVGYAINTENYLKNYPALLEKTWGNMTGEYKEEMILGLEFLSFLIDEEAISKLLPGDALFLLNGLYQQEVSYTEYTYDEDYNMTPVTKTKNETLPKFLFMVSSEQNKLTERLIQYGTKKEAITQTNGYYTVKIPDSPMNMFFGFKNNIWFFTNEEKDMKAITDGSFKANISEAEKKQLMEPNFSAYFNPKQVEKEISASSFEVTDGMTDMLNTLKKMNTIRFRSLPIVNNTISTEMLMEVPKGNKNGLVYFMDFINEIMKK